MYLTRQPGALAGEARRASGASAGERAEHARGARLAPARRRTTAEAVVETLALHGTELFFGVPGVHNDPLFDALHRARHRIRVLHARHEQAGGYMALGAALATGRPQAFAAVPGPGVLNASAALLTAYGMGAPVLALCGQIPSFALERGLGHLHEVPNKAPGSAAE